MNAHDFDGWSIISVGHRIIITIFIDLSVVPFDRKILPGNIPSHLSILQRLNQVNQIGPLPKKKRETQLNLT